MWCCLAILPTADRLIFFFKLICNLYQSIFCFVNLLLSKGSLSLVITSKCYLFHPLHRCMLYAFSSRMKLPVTLQFGMTVFLCVHTYHSGIHLYLFCNHLIYLFPSFKSALISNLLKDVSVLQHILSSAFSSCIISRVQQYPSTDFSLSPYWCCYLSEWSYVLVTLNDIANIYSLI